MSSTETQPRLTIGPSPDQYTEGPVTVRYQPNDGEPADDLKTFPSLTEATAWAHQTVERGFLAGELTFRPADQEPPATSLEDQVAAEQAEFEAAQEQYADESIRLAQGEEIDEPAPGPATLTETEAAALDAEPETGPDPTGYRIERVPPNAPTKVEHTGKTLDQARELLAAMRCRGGAILRLVASDGTVIDTKTPAVSAVEAEATEEPLPDPAPQDEGAEPEEQPAQLADATGSTTSVTITDTTTATWPAEALVEPTGQTALIDKTDYQREDLALPKIDGQEVDRIAFTFSGTIMLDRADPADVNLFRKLNLGHDVTLQVEGACAGYGGKGATNRDGDLDVVVATRRIKIHTIYLPAGAADDEAA
jgi:hypothetical protein